MPSSVSVVHMHSGDIDRVFDMYVLIFWVDWVRSRVSEQVKRISNDLNREGTGTGTRAR